MPGHRIRLLNFVEEERARAQINRGQRRNPASVPEEEPAALPLAEVKMQGSRLSAMDFAAPLAFIAPDAAEAYMLKTPSELPRARLPPPTQSRDLSTG